MEGDSSLTDAEVSLFQRLFTAEVTRLMHSSEEQNHWTRMIMSREKIQEIIAYIKVRNF